MHAFAQREIQKSLLASLFGIIRHLASWLLCWLGLIALSLDPGLVLLVGFRQLAFTFLVVAIAFVVSVVVRVIFVAGVVV